MLGNNLKQRLHKYGFSKLSLPLPLPLLLLSIYAVHVPATVIAKDVREIGDRQPDELGESRTEAVRAHARIGGRIVAREALVEGELAGANRLAYARREVVDVVGHEVERRNLQRGPPRRVSGQAIASEPNASDGKTTTSEWTSDRKQAQYERRKDHAE